jgi:hypothetical protein
MNGLGCVLALAVLFSATACQRERAAGTSHAAFTSATPPTHASASNAFTVDITLSPLARERLASRHESIIVRAEYFGDPSAKALQQRVPGSGNPWFTLHQAQVELEGTQLEGTPTARFPAVVLDPEKLAWTDAPDAPQVNVNVYSGRRTSPDNLLDCGMFQDALEVASRTPVRLSCALIGEASR